MYLKRLEMHGFKSFADRIEIEFCPGINAIVGPNGSGKSNVADAIRWVLGEQSIKNLRGSKLEDVIFAGSNSKKPMGMAEVALTLDNSDNMLPLEYSDICFTRRTFRSGESEFYINKVPCRLKDIQELLMDTGIGKDGYSIIGQGQVDEILTSRPEERRVIFEETAGIMKHKARKREAERRLEETLDNISRIDDILSEIQNQLEPLRQQKDKALKFQTLSEQLKELDINLMLSEIEKKDKKTSNIQNIIKECEEKSSHVLNRKTDLCNKINTLDAEAEKTEKELEIVQRDHLAAYSKKGELEKDLQFAVNEISRLKGEKEDYTNNIKHTLSQIESVKLTLNEKIAYLEEKIKLINKIELKIKEKENELSQKEHDINQINQRSESLKVDIIDLLNHASEKKNMISSLKTMMLNLGKRLQQVEKEIAQIVKTNDETLGDINNVNIRLKEFKKNCEHNEKKLKDVQSELDKLNEEYLQNQRQVSKTSDSLSALTSKYKALKEINENYEGYQSAVRNLLKAIKSNQFAGQGIYGTVADALSVKRHYELAIETALGGALQNIICDNENSAKKAIEFLKKYRLGRITFLPLVTVKPRVLTDDEKSLLSMPGCIGTAQELVTYDSKYNPVIANLLGKVLVVDHIDNALKIAQKSAYRIKIVTLQGELLNPGGSITGGIDKRDSSILSRKRQLKEYDNEIIELQKELNKLKEKGDKLKTECQAKQNLIEEIKSQLYEVKPEVSALEKELSEKENLIKERLERKKLFEYEKDQIIKETTDIQKEILNLEKDVYQIDDKNKSSQDEVKELQDKLARLAEQRDSLASELTELKVQLASYKQEQIAIEQMIASLEADLGNLKKQLERSQKHLENHTENVETLNRNISDLKAKHNAAKDECNKLKEREEQLKHNRESIKQNLENYREQLAEAEEEQNRLAKRLNDMRMNENTIIIEKNHIVNRLYEKYFMTLEDAIALKKDLGPYTQMKERMELLQKQIDELGPVNMQAIEDHENLSTRYYFIKSQRDDLVQAADKLNNLIRDITKTMEAIFISSLDKVREEFRKVFVELFGGGKAELVLVDDNNILEAGVDIIAQPPGKKLQSISLLSGGEKALTAIALLFAILNIKATPFCILDEIEAALDDANIDRFKNYLKKVSEHTQFIIITHRKGTMTVADTLYGITMEETAVSKVLGVKLEE